MRSRCWAVATVALVWACDGPVPARDVPAHDTAPAATVELPPVAAAASRVRTGVGIRALDGDSVRIRADGREIEVRLLSVDAPERDQPLADAARGFSHEWIAGASVRVVLDRETEDRYRRVLAYIERDEPDGAVSCLNVDLVEAGLALAYLRPPNTARADAILEAQAAAHAAGRGLWSGDFEEPRSFRERKRGARVRRDIAYSRWVIVGNERSRQAHWPGCRHVDEMAAKHRRMLTSLTEAERLGFAMERGYR